MGILLHILPERFPVALQSIYLVIILFLLHPQFPQMRLDRFGDLCSILRVNLGFIIALIRIDKW